MRNLSGPFRRVGLEAEGIQREAEVPDIAARVTLQILSFVQAGLVVWGPVKL